MPSSRNILLINPGCYDIMRLKGTRQLDSKVVLAIFPRVTDKTGNIHLIPAIRARMLVYIPVSSCNWVGAEPITAFFSM
jgi:hypothetical protein